jgi:hypothetical protein
MLAEAFKWDHVIWNVVAFYGQYFVVAMSYIISKQYADNSLTKPALAGVVMRAIGILMLMGLISWGFMASVTVDDSGSPLPGHKVNYNSVATLCILLSISSVVGMMKGYSSKPKTDAA